MRKILGVFLSMTVAASLLAGCGGASGAASAPKSDAQEVESASEEKTEEPAAEVVQEPAAEAAQNTEAVGELLQEMENSNRWQGSPERRSAV